MARPLTLLILLLLCVQTVSLHAKAPISRTYDRFKKGCEVDGSGLACYSYGRALWNNGGKKDAIHYFSRGCDLKYRLACQAYKDHSTITHQTRHRAKGANTKACFSKNDMTTARLTPQPALKTGVEGQKITGIKKDSFWGRAGLKDGDIIARLNNMHVDSEPEFLHAFESSGKSFGFEVVREGDTITLWYNCK